MKDYSKLSDEELRVEVAKALVAEIENADSDTCKDKEAPLETNAPRCKNCGTPMADHLFRFGVYVNPDRRINCKNGVPE